MNILFVIGVLPLAMLRQQRMIVNRKTRKTDKRPQDPCVFDRYDIATEDDAVETGQTMHGYTEKQNWGLPNWMPTAKGNRPEPLN